MHNGRVLEAGDVENVRRAAYAAAGDDAAVQLRELPGALLLPGLVNAHTHLDLTDVGYRPYIGNFTGWIKTIIQARAVGEDAVRASVHHGARKSLAAGVLTVGDIAGSEAAASAALQSGLSGVSFLELFGSIPSRLPQAGDAGGSEGSERSGGSGGSGGSAMRFGLQPHAPYSARPELYRWAARTAAERDWPLSTHVAETTEETEFTKYAEGPFRQLLADVGKWDDRLAGNYGRGRHPVDWLAHCGAAATGVAWLCAHCNYVEDAEIQTLARLGWSVAYCPRASEYFGHRGHPYRRMLDAGVNVCLGTDSIICHGSLSILDEMRRLYQRDATPATLLLKMATVNGMRALRLDKRDGAFQPGAATGLVAVRYHPQSRSVAESGEQALERVLAADQPAEVETLVGRAPGAGVA